MTWIASIGWWAREKDWDYEANKRERGRKEVPERRTQKPLLKLWIRQLDWTILLGLRFRVIKIEGEAQVIKKCKKH